VKPRLRLIAALAACALVGACTGSPPAPAPVGAASAHVGAAPSATGSAPAGSGAKRTITVLGAGDELLHEELWAQASKDAKAAGKSGLYFDPIFQQVAPAIAAADVAVCHMETPLAPAGGPYVGYPRFDAPPQIATTLHDIGYDTCSTASNHTLDYGTAGIKRTLDALDAAGLKHTGSYRQASQAQDPAVLVVTPKQGGEPVKVAQLSYTFGFNGLTRPEPWVANLTDAHDILAAAHRAKQAGAQIVVVSLHWGIEYAHTPNQGQKDLAAQLLASPDIDLILGCHEHVVQPIGKASGKWVVYGMGNQVARHSEPINDNREGIMPEFTFTEAGAGKWTVTTAAFVPTWVELSPNIRVIDLPAAIADPATSPANLAVYRAALKRITGYVDGTGQKPAVTSGLPTR
jgi:poly-gamma-glutamate synthesis protein (capsule biosynthesis protein)